MFGADVFLTVGLWILSVAPVCPFCFSSSWDQWVIQDFFLFLMVKVAETQEESGNNSISMAQAQKWHTVISAYMPLDNARHMAECQST